MYENNLNPIEGLDEAFKSIREFARREEEDYQKLKTFNEKFF